MTKIANPIYDVVFKYLMSDNKIAKLVLSTILGREVATLSFRDTEKRTDIENTITNHRLDFSAEILDESGKKEVVIIELQKIRLPADIHRFRRYLGEQYIAKENTFTGTNDKGDPEEKAMPIISIYFLGYKLYKTDAPVIRINRKTIDNTTNELITEKTEFTESLTHDSFIIQIPYLKEKRRNDIEKLLAVFDQRYKDTEAYHALNLNEDDFPEKFREIFRRLVKAYSEPHVRRTMDLEDDLVDEIRNKDLAIEKRDLALEEKDKALNEKEKIILGLAKTLKDSGKTTEEILELTNLSKAEIDNL